MKLNFKLAWFKKIKIGDSDVLESFSPYGFAGVWNQFGMAIWDNDDLIGHTGGTTGASALFIMSPENHFYYIKQYGCRYAENG